MAKYKQPAGQFVEIELLANAASSSELREEHAYLDVPETLS